MDLIRLIAFALLASLLTYYSGMQLWFAAEYLPQAHQAIDPQPWKAIWAILWSGVAVCAVAGVVGMWINLRRRAYRWMGAFMALQLLFPVILEQLRRDTF